VPPNPELRDELARLSLEELAARLGRSDPAALAAIDIKNPRRLIRAIEVVETTGRPYAEARVAPAPTGAQMIGLTMPRERLYARIEQRYDAMLAAGWLDEVRGLLARGYGRELPSMSSLGYRELAAHLAGELTLEQAIEAAKARCRRYARMQYNWFRPDDSRIKWIEAGPGAHDEIARLAEGESTA
jgi:tRNA dimethylallyltransferase